MLWLPPGLHFSRGAVDAATLGGGFTALTPPTVTADNVFVIDLVSNTVLMEDEPDEVKDMASITKLMTMILAVDELGDLDSTSLTATTADTTAGGGGTTAGLLDGDVLSVRDCIEGAAIPSGNDAAYCLGRHTNQALGGLLTVTTQTVTAMNSRAAALGMTNTTFTDVHGATGGANTASARDCALLLKEVITNYPDVVAATKLRTAGLVITGGRSTTLTVNTTNSCYGEPGILSTKTGTTGVANKGNVITHWESRTGEKCIAVVLDATNATTRFADMRKVLTAVQGQVKWSGGLPVLRDDSAADFVPERLFITGTDRGTINDPSDLRSMFVDVNADVRVSADGHALKRWTDQLGRTTTEATNNPLYKTSGGLHWALFDGTNDCMFATGADLFQVASFATLMWAGTNTDTATIRYMFFCSTTTGTSTRVRMGIDAADKLQIGCRRLDADALTTAAGATVLGAGTRTYRGEFDWAGTNIATAYLNNVSQTVVNPLSAAGAGTTSNTTGTRMIAGDGSGGGPGNFWNGPCHFALMINRALTAPETANLEAYARAKAGL